MWAGTAVRARPAPAGPAVSALSAPVRAAGGVLWRPASHQPAGDGDPSRPVEPVVCLVHRARYDDYSLPKGKLGNGEPAWLGACREVHEETGARFDCGIELSARRYITPDGTVKQVRYWAMRWRGGAFTPSDEVDRVLWLAPAAARARLSYPGDAEVLDSFQRAPRETASILLIRHARAGDRARWTGPDETRPLDARGRRDAAGLAVLADYVELTAAHSAPLTRCRATVAPLAAAAGISVADRPELAEDTWMRRPAATQAFVARIVDTRRGAALCSQGGVIPALVASAAAQLPPAAEHRPARKAIVARKGSVWVLTYATTGLVGMTYLKSISQ